jgi:pimeloyl-ACP methyl ester carboxylesterase
VIELLNVVLLAVAGWMLLQVALRVLAPKPAPADEEVEVRTADGWTLRLYHTRPKGTPRGVPVILGHGYTMSRACWELSPRSSMVRALAEAGHDLWVPHYRGDPGTTGPGGRPLATDAGLEELATKDLPALIEAVRQATGAPRVAWVGHSMGGMLIYLYLAQFGSGALDRVVTLGSPVTFQQFRGLFGGILNLARGIGEGWRRLPVRQLAHIGLLFISLWPRAFMGFAARMSNLSRREQMALVVRGLVNPWTRLTRDFLDIVELRQILVSAGPEGWNGHPPHPLGVGAFLRLDVPLLVIAADKDRLAPPEAVAPAASVAGERAIYRVFGGGDSGLPSLGHGDLISSEFAVRHVAPRLSAFLLGG